MFYRYSHVISNIKCFTHSVPVLYGLVIFLALCTDENKKREDICLPHQGDSQYLAECGVLKTTSHCMPGLLLCHEWAFTLSNTFYVSIEILIFFLHYPANSVNHFGWFWNIKPTLHEWHKSQLVIMYYHFYILPDSIWKYVLQDFWIYAQKRY